MLIFDDVMEPGVELVLKRGRMVPDYLDIE